MSPKKNNRNMDLGLKNQLETSAPSLDIDLVDATEGYKYVIESAFQGSVSDTVYRRNRASDGISEILLVCPIIENQEVLPDYLNRMMDLWDHSTARLNRSYLGNYANNALSILIKDYVPLSIAIVIENPQLHTLYFYFPQIPEFHTQLVVVIHPDGRVGVTGNKSEPMHIFDKLEGFSSADMKGDCNFFELRTKPIYRSDIQIER